TQAAIEYQAAGPVAAKGKRERVAAWEVVGARARLGGDVPLGVRTALVGRERELHVLPDALARVRGGRAPQWVTLVGGPGIGKSRLLYELSQIADAEPQLISWRQGRSLPYGEGVSFWALAEMVKAQAGILESDTSDEAEAKLAAMMADLVSGTPDADWVRRHLGALAGLSGGSASIGGDRRGGGVAARRPFFRGAAEERPLVP